MRGPGLVSGTGLLGTSLGLALRELGVEVLLADPSPATLHLARELGALGVLGMHLSGYGCAGTDATSYGLACLELEAADSGVRSLVSGPRAGSSTPSISSAGCVTGALIRSA